MPQPPRPTFQLRPHDAYGTWESNDRRYRSYAHELLAMLEALCKEVLAKWPPETGSSIRAKQHPQLWKLARQRDRTSDTVRIYSAMAVEGFLNFYGVLRLGQAAFDDHFERLRLVPKLRALLLVCDALQIGQGDKLVVLLSKVAQARNALVHPKVREVQGPMHKPTSILVPEVAREAVTDMEAFFEEFKVAVPAAADHLILIPFDGGD
jgi:hypothetical protein